MSGVRSIDRTNRTTARRGRETAPGGRTARPPRRIMLASTGSPIAASAVDRAAELVAELGDDRPTQVVVIAVARIWGTSLGLPNPGLYPNRLEWEEVRSIAETAAAELRRRGIAVKTKSVASRHAGKTVASWAEYLGCRAIVVGAPEMSTWDRWLHGDEPRNVARRTKIPVHHVPLPPEPRKRSGFVPREA